MCVCVCVCVCVCACIHTHYIPASESKQQLNSSPGNRHLMSNISQRQVIKSQVQSQSERDCNLCKCSWEICVHAFTPSQKVSAHGKIGNQRAGWLCLRTEVLWSWEICVSCFRTEVLMGNLCVFPVLGWKCSWEICVHVFHLRMEVLMGNPCACFLS